MILQRHLTTCLILVISSVGTLVANDDSGNVMFTSRDALPADALLMMDSILSYYMPGCLRVQISSGKTSLRVGSMAPRETSAALSKYKFIKQIGMYSDLYHENNLSNSTMQPSIAINLRNIEKSQGVIEYINKHTDRVTPQACVTYLFPSPPDPRLMPALTDPEYGRRLNRYFLVYAVNATEAEGFLLDQRLEKQDNMAALVQEELENHTYWRVLIRQLLHPSGSPQVLTVNRWSREKGLASTENIFPDQMANFYGRKLKGCILSYRPFIIFKKIEGTLTVKPKPCIDVLLLNMTADKMNFTYELANPPDGFWSGIMPNGTFQGVVGEVQAGRSNFSLLLSRTLHRSQAVDFTRVYYPDPLSFMTPTSPPVSPWSKVVTPFRTSVWVCVLISVCGGTLLYHVIYHAQASLTSSLVMSAHPALGYNIHAHPASSTAFMSVWASFLTQSLHRYLWLQSGRVFLGFWFLYAFLVTSHYSTSLTSTLAVPFAPPAINTLEQLYDSEFDYGVKGQSSVHEYFLFSVNELYRNMLDRMILIKTDAGHMQKMDLDNYAYISFKSFLRFNMVLHNNNPKRNNELRIATQEFYPGGFAWGFPKGASYRRGFDQVMLRCSEAGLIYKWFGDLTTYYVREARENMTPEERERDREKTKLKNIRQMAFSLNHLQGPFFMLLLGYATGVILLMVEVLWVKS